MPPVTRHYISRCLLSLTYTHKTITHSKDKYHAIVHSNAEKGRTNYSNEHKNEKLKFHCLFDDVFVYGRHYFLFFLTRNSELEKKSSINNLMGASVKHTEWRKSAGFKLLKIN